MRVYLGINIETTTRKTNSCNNYGPTIENNLSYFSSNSHRSLWFLTEDGDFQIMNGHLSSMGTKLLTEGAEKDEEPVKSRKIVIRDKPFHFPVLVQ